MKNWLIILLIFVCAILMHRINATKDDSMGTTPTRTVKPATEGFFKYRYEVTDKVRCWIDAKPVTVKDYQTAMELYPDGVAGKLTMYETISWNNNTVGESK